MTGWQKPRCQEAWKIPCHEISNSFYLSLEKAAVFVNGNKLTTDVSKEVRFCLGESDARQFYTAPVKKKGGGLGWSTARFEAVDWRALDKCLASKSDMYGMWLTKQSTGTCATRYNMARLYKIWCG